MEVRSARRKKDKTSVLRLIKQEPGITTSEIKRRHHWGVSRTRSVLDALLRDAAIERRPWGKFSHWFVKGKVPKARAKWQAAYLLRDPEINELHRLTLHFPGHTEGQYVVYTGWHPGTLRHWLYKLVAVGLVEHADNPFAYRGVPLEELV